MDIRGVIAKKRDGRELATDEIAWTVNSYTQGAISDAQMAALLMAIVLRGMTARETADLTLAMLNTGDRLDLSSIPGTKVDKHSTGGVGDKTTLVVAPLVASFGVGVPKMSGRALGHTGGTIDKLECVPGLKTELSPTRFAAQVAAIGVAIAAQSAQMVPADAKIYALRNVTGTTESVPLIASSVMSKKLAVGADGIVLDVKAGRGALVPDVASARKLATAMIEIGARAGKKMVAVVTRMDQPLGRAVGDAVELVEAIETLNGRGPRDFVAICTLVAGHMLTLGGVAADARQGRAMAARALRTGAGLAKLRELVRAQDGDPTAVDDPAALTREATFVPVRCDTSGHVTGVDARAIGETVRELKSAAAERKPLCGLLLEKKVGDAVTAGETIARVAIPRPIATGSIERAARNIAGAFRISATPRVRQRLLIATLRA
jgi:pyrimidine-nucleoside phosphorylase